MDAVDLEIVRHALAGVAEEMGAALRRAAYSPNIKERADCSAAVFDADGVCVAQAEHIPVHLGAMPASVAAVLEAFGGALAPGTTAAVNDPYRGGTHLPDITLVRAVGDADGRLVGYVANRAHHADVGGATPGSMPTDATDVAAEGLRIPPLVVADADGVRSDVMGLLAANSRTPNERMGDLRAQMAANHVGARRLADLAAGGSDGLASAMRAVVDYTERRVRAALRELPSGTWRATDHLEVGDGVAITAAVTIDGGRMAVDLTGSDPQQAVGCNCPAAVAASAALFVLTLIADPDAPANDGRARCLDLTVPAGSVVGATFPAPVATGNTETSQKVVDVLVTALAEGLGDAIPALGQGTMNNLVLGAGPGAAAYSYYETIGGGEGGSSRRAGMSGVHTAMTNTANTPVEALELAYPLRVRRSELRRGSGGAGVHPGGDGVVREIEVLTDAVVTLAAERRASAPSGRAGGADGAPGADTIIHPDGRREPVPGRLTRHLLTGSRIEVATPGGGGWGAPRER